MTESDCRNYQTSVIYAEVNGFVEKKQLFTADYLFVVEVFWSDNRTTFVKRKYKEFVQFYKRIKDYFRSKVKSKEISTPIWIPNIKGVSAYFLFRCVYCKPCFARFICRFFTFFFFSRVILF